MQAPQEKITKDDIVAANPEITAKNIDGFPLEIPKASTPTPKGTAEADLFFVCTSESLGKGEFSVVYKTYPIESRQTKKVDFTKAFATKVVQKEFNPIEYELFSNYYRAFPPHQIDSKVYLVTELLPGHDLFDDQEKLNVPFRNLDFGTTLEVIQSLCSAVNTLHHETPMTGSAVAHNDLKGKNIKVFIDKVGRIKVFIFDFGLSDKIEHNPNATVKGLTSKGTAFYVPPECLEKTYSIKGDIWALVPISAALLGAINPFALRENPALRIEQVIKTKYDFNGLFGKFRKDLASMQYPFHNVVLQFLNRMQEPNYKARFDSDEVLKFFTAFNLAYKIAKEIKIKETTDPTLSNQERQKNEQDKIQLLADLKTKYCTMLLLSFKVWEPSYARIIDNIDFQEKLLKAIHSRSLTADMLQGFVNEANAYEDKIVEIKGKLKNNRGKYSAKFLEKFSIFAEHSPYEAEAFLAQLEKLTGSKKTTFDTILAFETTFNTNIDIKTLAGSIAENPKHTIELIVQCSNAFCQDRKNNKQEETVSSKLLGFLTYSDSEILQSTENLLSITQGSHKQLSSKDITVLRSTALGKLLEATNGFEVLAMTTSTNQSKRLE